MEHDVLADKLQVTLDDVQEALRSLGQQASGVKLMSGGLLNSNFRVELEDGPALLRAYPNNRDINEIEFEVEVVKALLGSPCHAPRVLADGQIGRIKGRPFILMSFIEGRTLAEEDIDTRLAREAGALLANFHSAVKGTRPQATKPRNDVRYIVELVNGTVRGLHSDEATRLSRSADKIWHEVGGPHEWGDPDGIVHGDYYVENLIRAENGDLFVIDFDDSYYGTTVFDVAIGAMEFSADADQSLSRVRLTAFLEGYHSVDGLPSLSSFDLRRAMLINCLRFLCYTLPLTYESGGTVRDNEYYVRANLLLDNSNDLPKG